MWVEKIAREDAAGVVEIARGSLKAALPPPSAQIAQRWLAQPAGRNIGPPRFFFERYRKPLLITENGLSVRDWVAVDGAVHDTARIDFTTRYLRALHRAIRDGAEVRGYFHWSILDNFEWAEGYKERFGLIYVDYQTQKRTLKDSAYWYRRVIDSNGASLF